MKRVKCYKLIDLFIVFDVNPNIEHELRSFMSMVAINKSIVFHPCKYTRYGHRTFNDMYMYVKKCKFISHRVHQYNMMRILMGKELIRETSRSYMTNLTVDDLFIFI